MKENMTVMIVDDNVLIRDLIRFLIEDRAEAIIECSDGEEAVRMYESKSPDIVLMDIKMQKVDGIAAMKQIIQQDPEAKIVMVTEYNDKGLQEAAKNAGAKGYILKEHLSEIEDVLDFSK